ncbi:MAG: hypothetical protein M3R37_09990 [Actinomycetota bacterium]|nr:hypothetical protein [Actinomycetota bacterium]
MAIGWPGCPVAEDRLVQMLLGTLAVTESLEMEEHVSGCATCARTLRDLALAASAYDRAFARLRSRRAHIAPGRARLAAAAEHRVGFAVAVSARLARSRLAEAALTFGVMTYAIIVSVGIDSPRATAPSSLPSPSVVVAPMPTAPAPEDAQRMRVARLKYLDVGDIVFRVPAGSPY